MMASAPKSSKNVRLALIGGQDDGWNVNPSCWCIDTEHQLCEFTRIPADSCVRWHSICVTDNGFAVTGGRDSRVCVMFRAASRSWEQLQTLLATRHSHGSVCVHGMLFVMGGRVAGTRSDSVDYLTIGTEEGWKHTASLPVAMILPNVVSMNADVFLLDQSDSKLYLMDVRSKSWSSRSPMPEKGSCLGVSMAATNNALYVAGGRSSNLFAWYTPSTDTWSTGTQHSKRHGYGALIYMDDTLYLLGGFHTEDVEEYNIKEGTWSVSRCSMPQQGRLHGVVVDLPE